MLLAAISANIGACGGSASPARPGLTSAPSAPAPTSPPAAAPALDAACLPMPSQPEVCLARRVRFDEACPAGTACRFDASTFRWGVVPGPGLEEKLAPMRGGPDRIVVSLGRDSARPALVVEYDLDGHVRRRLESGAVEVLPRANGDWVVVEPHRLHLLDASNRVVWEVVPGAAVAQRASLLADDADGVVVQLEGAPASEIIAIGNDGFVRWRYVVPAGINLERTARVGRETLILGLVTSGEHRLTPRGPVFRRAESNTVIAMVLDDRGHLTRARAQVGDELPYQGVGWVTIERKLDHKSQRSLQTVTARTSTDKLRWRWDVAATTPGWTQVDVTSLFSDRDGLTYASANCVGPDPAAPQVSRATVCTLRLGAAGTVKWIVPMQELSAVAYAEMVERTYGGVAEKTRFAWTGLDVGKVGGARLAVGLSSTAR